MTEPNYIDIAAMQKVVDERNAKRSEEFHASLQRMGDRRIAERNANSDLLAKAILSEREDNKKKRDAAAEIEKAKAIAEVEAKYEQESGVKSADTLKLDAAYRTLLPNIPGIND